MRRKMKNFVKIGVLSVATITFTVIIFKVLRSVDRQYYSAPEFEFAINNRIPNRKLEPPMHFIQESPAENIEIDWHDYAFIEKEKRRTGVGEHGVAATLTAADSPEYEKLYSVNGFNAALSDKISVERAVPDIRHKGCQKKKYLKNLPTVSVIVPFHNEHWTTLLRTAYSVLNRSPSQLLKEIILVDDCSTKEFSKKPLGDYVRVNMTKTRVVHLPERRGLILARIAGAEVATGDVLIFLDSHTEANVNWLPPLLDPIARDYKTCVCPFIDVVAFETFEYRAQDEGARGAFDWEFFYKRLPLLPEDLKHPTEPFKSPIMAGGLFAISTKFFWELGGYDPGLDIWGGEQYELSFKIWQCGGQMFDAPCSRVGHIYRKFAPFPNPRKGDFVGKNYRRVAEVWMDEYAEYLYIRRPHYKDIDPGDLTKQKAIREKLQCKPFKWFMEEVAFDLPKKYPPIEPPDFAYGEIRNLGLTSYCVDSSREHMSISKCQNHRYQNFTLSWHKDIRPNGKTQCWDVSDPNDKAPITLFGCHGMGGNQYWKYDLDKKWLIHGGNPRCLDFDLSSKKLYVTECDKDSKTQRWKFGYTNFTAIANLNKQGPS